MPIQLIEINGRQAFQVRVGPRSNTLTAYFAATKHGGLDAARKKAERAEARLRRRADPVAPRTGPRTKPPANNTSGLVGLQVRYEQGVHARFLYVAASWCESGKPCGMKVSADKHGPINAVRIAMERREKATGQSYGLTPRQAWARLRRGLGGEARA